jgi:hypothetical protein
LIKARVCLLKLGCDKPDLDEVHAVITLIYEYELGWKESAR